MKYRRRIYYSAVRLGQPYGVNINKGKRNTQMFAQFATIVSAAFYDLAIHASAFVEQVQYTLAV